MAQLKAQRALLNNRISLLENTDILGIQIKRGNLRTKDHDVPQNPEDRKAHAKHKFFLEDLQRYNTHRFFQRCVLSELVLLNGNKPVTRKSYADALLPPQPKIMSKRK